MSTQTGKKSQRPSRWEKLGRVLYWLTWPGVWLTIQLSPPRTRIVLEYKGKILLIKDWMGNGQWTLPGGGLHRREPINVGAARELLEETAITVDHTKFKSAGNFRIIASGMPVRVIGLWYEVYQEPKVRIRKGEVISYRWASKKELGSLQLHPTAQAVISAVATSRP